MKVRALKIKDIVQDTKYYPRVRVNWLTVVDYIESLKAGAKFPPVAVAKWKNKYILIDGFHRVEAYKRCGYKVIQGDIIKVKSEVEIFKEAVKRNINHGRPLSPYEKRLVIHRGLKQFKIPKIELQDLVHIRAEKFDLFQAKCAKSIFSGKDMSEIIFKSPSAEGIKEDISEEDYNQIKEGENALYGTNQITLLKNVLFLIRQNLMNLKNENVYNLLVELKEELKRII